MSLEIVSQASDAQLLPVNSEDSDGNFEDFVDSSENAQTLPISIKKMDEKSEKLTLDSDNDAPGGSCDALEKTVLGVDDEKISVARSLSVLSDEDENRKEGRLNELSSEIDNTSTPPAEKQENGRLRRASTREGSSSSLAVERSASVESAALSDDGASLLRLHDRHVFVLSHAGKPIYTRHGSEEDLSSLFPLMQALVSFVGENGSTASPPDNLLSMCHHRNGVTWRLAFLRRQPLILVAASRRAESAAQLLLQLDLLYHQLLSYLTAKELHRIFTGRPNYDLRRLLVGTQPAYNSLADLCAEDPALMLNAVRCLPMSGALRDQLGQAIVSAASAVKTKTIVFGLVVARRQLVAMVRMKKYTLHPADVHLILNLVACNPSFRHSDSWSPICLPRFDDSGFLYAHISYPWEECPACLLLLTVERNQFYTLSEVRDRASARLLKSKTALAALTDATANPAAVRISEIGLPDLWHFVYKNRASAQLCYPAFEPPYVSSPERRLLFDRYLQVIDTVHNNAADLSHSNKKSSLRILYSPGGREAVLAWVTSNFQLYAVFSPGVQKQSAIVTVEKLMKWLKREEERLFILSPQLL